MTFADKLLQLRKQNNLSQEDVANQIGVSRQAISRWETGEILPDSKNLIKLCKLFKVSADYLIHDAYLNNNDIPSVQMPEETLLKSFLFRQQVTILIGISCIVLLVGIIVSYLLTNPFWIILFCTLVDILNIICFEYILHRQEHYAIAEERKKYYRIVVWSNFLFPLVLISGVYLRTALLYLLICSVITLILSKKRA